MNEGATLYYVVEQYIKNDEISKKIKFCPDASTQTIAKGTTVYIHFRHQITDEEAERWLLDKLHLKRKQDKIPYWIVDGESVKKNGDEMCQEMIDLEEQRKALAQESEALKEESRVLKEKTRALEVEQKRLEQQSRVHKEKVENYKEKVEFYRASSMSLEDKIRVLVKERRVLHNAGRSQEHTLTDPLRGFGSTYDCSSIHYYNWTSDS